MFQCCAPETSPMPRFLSTRRSWIVAIVIALLAVSAAVLSIGRWLLREEFAHSEAEERRAPTTRRLEELARQKATLEDLRREFGDFTLYEKGTKSWDDLLTFLR